MLRSNNDTRESIPNDISRSNNIFVINLLNVRLYSIWNA